MAALMGSRLSSKIKHEHNMLINDVVYWSDSKTVLYWIRSDPGRYKQFVANRLGEIQELTETHQWHWVPTKENVADDATRADLPTDFNPNGRWYTGPQFRMLPKQDWPVETVVGTAHQLTDEVKTAFVGFIKSTREFPFPDIQRFSSFTKLIRATAWVMRFLTNTRSKKFNCDPLNVFELFDAEILWRPKV